jgi:hypothetical protein
MEADTISKIVTNLKNLISREKYKLLTLLILGAGIFTFVMCKKDDGPNSVPKKVVELINDPEVFKEAAVLARTEVIIPGSQSFYWDRSNEKPDWWVDTKSMDDLDCYVYNTEWSCDSVNIRASENPEDFAMINPNASVLWPGNLVQGASLESGIPTTIPVVASKRQPGNISLAIVSSAGQVGAPMYLTVDNMLFSTVNQAMNDILRGFEGHGYAQYSFEYNYIESKEELEFVLNASFKGFGASAKAGLKINNTDQYKYALIKLHQSYFTMVYDDPAGLDGVFTSDITVNDLRNYTGDGNPMCYISSVTYGRVFYLLYETTATKEDLEFTLNASFSGFGVNADADTKLKINDTLQKTRAMVSQFGGDAQNSFTNVMALNLEAITDFMEKGANFSAQSPGAPISYTVKYLKNAQVVRLQNAMNFTVRRCEPQMTQRICPELPQVSTNEVTTFTSTTADMGGNIKFEGVPPYSDKGVVFNTSPNPNIDNNYGSITKSVGNLFL